MSTVVPGCKVWKLSDKAEAWFARYREQLQAQHPGQPISEYDYAMAAFGALPFKSPILHEFLLLCECHQWGTEFGLESDGVVNDWAIRMAKGFCLDKRVNLMGCGSSWKTGNASAYVYTMWKSRPFSTSIFLSTTSGEAAQSRTWGQVKDWHSRDRYAIGKRIESLHLITLDKETEDRDYRNSVKVVLIKPGNEGKNVMASIVGRKNERVIWVVDEFPFMDIGILDARVNLNTAGPFNQFIGLGNAPEEGDPMYLDAAPYGPKYPDGWRSINKDADKSWPTKTGICLYFNGEKSPNYKVGPGVKFPFPRMMNEGFRLELLKDSGGEDTPMYWKQFHGFPPTVDISDKVLTYKLLERNGAFGDPLWQNAAKKILAGLDLGFRAEGDPCVIDFGRLGVNTEGRTILCCSEDGIALAPKQGSKDAFEVQIAKRVIEECRLRGCADLALDVTGDGGILLQHIEREARESGYKLTVTPVSFSGSASDRPVAPGDKRLGKEVYASKVAEIWGQMRLCVLNQVVVGMKSASNAVTQLCARKMGSDEKKRMTIEKKSDMKKRLRRSPDHADARCLLVFLALQHGLSGMVVAPVVKKPVASVTDNVPKIARYAEHATGRYGGR